MITVVLVKIKRSRESTALCNRTLTIIYVCYLKFTF